jgi:uncharacterized membrane protein
MDIRYLYFNCSINFDEKQAVKQVRRMKMDQYQTAKFDRALLKSNAKAQIKGNIGVLFVCTLLISLITGAATPILGAGFLIGPSFSMSIFMIYLGMTRNIKPRVGDIFKGFDIFGKALWLSIITGFFVMLWTMLFIIPGMVKALSYSMAPYILAENPNMTAREALRESKRITDGYKLKLFVLELSFIGWIMLGSLTLGLLYIWLTPYMNATLANAYLVIKNNGRT